MMDDKEDGHGGDEDDHGGGRCDDDAGDREEIRDDGWYTITSRKPDLIPQNPCSPLRKGKPTIHHPSSMQQPQDRWS